MFNKLIKGMEGFEYKSQMKIVRGSHADVLGS